MSTINETVTAALRDRGYGSYVSMAGPVVEVLEDRERQISERLFDYAKDNGADEDEIRTMFRELGLPVTEPPAEDDDDDDEWTDERIGAAFREVRDSLAGIARSIEAMTAFARRNGYAG